MRAGVRLAVYDIVKGPGGDVHFPVPWARRPEISFLATEDEIRALLEQSGFEVLTWKDATPPALSWIRERSVALQSRAPALGFQLLLGSDAKAMFANQVRNLEEDRIRLVQLVAEAR